MAEFADYESRAGAILNMVEGFYKSQFGIVFDTLSMTFMDTVLFDETSDSSALLGDIRAKRRDGEIPFLEKPRSIFYFVSGRSLDSGIAGIAYVGSLCGGSGFATGLSRASNSNASTAVIAAHEIGHNLGARHDSASGSNGNDCPTGQNIMSPSVRGSYSSFSSCSFDYITDDISSLPAVEQCFNFPADVRIQADANNPAEVTEGEIYMGAFNVAYQDASQPADSIAVEGSIGDGEGSFSSSRKPKIATPISWRSPTIVSTAFPSSSTTTAIQ